MALRVTLQTQPTKKGGETLAIVRRSPVGVLRWEWIDEKKTIARVKAAFVHHRWIRRGIGRRLYCHTLEELWPNWAIPDINVSDDALRIWRWISEIDGIEKKPAGRYKSCTEHSEWDAGGGHEDHLEWSAVEEYSRSRTKVPSFCKHAWRLEPGFCPLGEML